MIEKVQKLARKYQDGMVKFLREMISIPSESCQEKEVIQCIKREMDKVGFDEVMIDGLGNIIGRIGNGKKKIAMDGHVDTVGVGDRSLWKVDPFKGKLENGVIYGRGASDQEASMASMVYAVKIIKELNLLDDYTLYITGTVMEEDCDGLCWQYIIKEDKIVPDCVIITEPTNLNIYRGQRGRMEILIKTKGVSCHGSAPERGENAIYKMTPIIQEIEKLNSRLKGDPFLGKGTVTVTQIFFTSPSACAVPDSCTIQLDRRLTFGETKESAIKEIEALYKPGTATVEVTKYARPAYTGKVYPAEGYFPTWKLDENSILLKKSVETYRKCFSAEPKIDKWTFSTNGIATMGMFNIPTVGFGPAHEIYAHSVDDQVPVEHLVKAAMFYALFPKTYCQ